MRTRAIDYLHNKKYCGLYTEPAASTFMPTAHPTSSPSEREGGREDKQTVRERSESIRDYRFQKVTLNRFPTPLASGGGSTAGPRPFGARIRLGPGASKNKHWTHASPCASLRSLYTTHLSRRTTVKPYKHAHFPPCVRARARPCPWHVQAAVTDPSSRQIVALSVSLPRISLSVSLVLSRPETSVSLLLHLRRRHRLLLLVLLVLAHLPSTYTRTLVALRPQASSTHMLRLPTHMLRLPV